MTSRAQTFLLLCILFASPVAADPTVSTQDFISSLNLDAPELALIRNHAEQHQWEEACGAYVSYLKTRQNPTYFGAVYSHPSSPSPRPDTSWADAIVRHQYIFSSQWYDLGSNIDWASNQTSGPEETLEWSATLNRHSNFLYLADAYRATGEDRYAREMLNLIDDWVTKATPPLDNPGVAPYDPYWEILNVAVRAGKTWPAIFYATISSPELSGVQACRWLRSWRENAFQLERYPTAAGNWLTFEMIGLYTIGNIFPEMVDAQRWRRLALDKMLGQLNNDFYPDGISRELTHSYGTDQFMNIVSSIDLAHLNHSDSELPPRYTEAIEKMFNYTMLVTKPNGRMPNFNDSVELTSSGTLQKGFEVFPQRTDFRWVATNGTLGTMPTVKSYPFDYAGHYVMRSDWSDQARYLLFDGGPFGSRGHGHEDKLSFILSAYGRDLVLDFGVWFPYDDSKWREYAISTRAHNTVVVNDQGQDGRDDPFRYGHPYPFQPLGNLWISNDQFDLVSAKYDLGYDRGIRVKHTRDIVFVKPDYWVVLDTLDPEADESSTYTYDSFFHLNTEEVSIAPETNSILTLNADANLLLMAMNPANHGTVSVSSTKGKETEPVQGWAHINNNFMAAPAAQFRFRGPGRQRLVTLLYPLRTGQGSPVDGMDKLDVFSANGQISDDAATGIEIRYSDGSKDQMLIGNEMRRDLVFAGQNCSEFFCWRRVEAGH